MDERVLYFLAGKRRACLLRAFTVSNGKEFLSLEQRPVRVSDDESAHRFIVYFKVVTDD